MAKSNHIFKKIRSGSMAEKLASSLSDASDTGSVRRISTVGEVVEAGMVFDLRCGDCGFHRTMTGPEMVSEFGRETEIRTVRPSCETCDGRALSLIPVTKTD